jgi:hypothetical protein
MKKDKEINEVPDLDIFTRQICSEYDVDVETLADRAAHVVGAMLNNLEKDKTPSAGIMDLIKEQFTHNELAYLALYEFSNTLLEMIKDHRKQENGNKPSFS